MKSRVGRSLRRDDAVLESDLTLQRQLLPNREAVRFPCRNRTSTSPRQNHTPPAMSCVIVCVMTILCEVGEEYVTRGAVHSKDAMGKWRGSAQVLLHLGLQLLKRRQHHRVHYARARRATARETKTNSSLNQKQLRIAIIRLLSIIIMRETARYGRFSSVSDLIVILL